MSSLAIKSNKNKTLKNIKIQKKKKKKKAFLNVLLVKQQRWNQEVNAKGKHNNISMHKTTRKGDQRNKILKLNYL